jgi:hypothetical protein
MSEMEQNEFERALARAMRRVDPPETLTKFLMRAAGVEAESRLPRKERKSKWAWIVPQVCLDERSARGGVGGGCIWRRAGA